MLKIDKTWIVSSSLLVLVIFSLIFFGIFRTFDWTDEAWSLSLIQNRKNTGIEPWAFQYLLNPIFELFGQSILFFRFIRLISFILLGLFAAFVFIKLATILKIILSTTQKLTIIFVSQIGTFLAWSFPPRYFAYNELTSLAVQMIVLLILFEFIHSESEKKQSYWRISIYLIWGLIGLLLGLLLYTKFTAFVVLLPIIILAIVLKSNSNRLLIAIWSFIGLSISIAIPILMGLPFVDYVRAILLNIFDERVREGNAHPSGMLAVYFADFLTVYEAVLPGLLLFLGFLILSFPIVKQASSFAKTFSRLSILFLFASLSLATIYVFDSGSNAIRTGRIAILLFLVAALIFLALYILTQINFSSLSPNLYFAFGLILIAPVFVSFGTNNLLSSHLGFGATLWAASAGFGLILFDHKVSAFKPVSSWFSKSLSLFFLVVSFYAVLSDARSPYGSDSIFSEKVPVKIGGVFEGLSLSKSEVEFQEWLKASAEKLDAADTKTIAVNSPGALLVFNNNDFANPWLWSFFPASYWSISQSCDNNQVDDLLVMLPKSIAKDSVDYGFLASELRDGCGLNFPEDFDVVDNFDSQNPKFSMSIYKLK